ncbi:MAG: DNA topoisomerase I [Candidatus Micrarchaeota archaeon]|nr:DNA topoisomerase I [Candidatus Micrarchaeota archaeon]
MNTLLIAEKPSVALRLAIALGQNTQKRQVVNGVSYYEIQRNEGMLYIAAAVGHIYTVRQKGLKHGYPVLDVEWVASYEENPKADYTKKYLEVFQMLATKCDRVINGCDYDIEGTVIGTNIIKFVFKKLDKAQRMKYSTTTIPDLQNAYAHLESIDLNNFYAGEARHMLDWLWGINLSRALSSAISATSFRRPLSIGRVQGPTLAILAKREIDISNFVPKNYWKVAVIVDKSEFSNVKGDMFDQKMANDALEETKKHLKDAFIEDVEENEQMVRPYPPFDLTSLQLEASRALRIDPSMTLQIAQSLYEKAYISYPRTSSQKLPPTLGLSRIIGELAKNPAYAPIANRLIQEKRFRPNEGIKSDAAHPAIYPTGVMPKTLTQMEERVYDLITKRFLSCFAGYAKVAKMKVTAKIGAERFSANGSRITERGWLEFYDYATMAEKMLPKFTKGQKVSATDPYIQEFQTQPPRRYSKAMLLSELEKKNLGTKATRAAIIDTLFRRGYIDGIAIKATNFGMSVYKALNDYANMIVSEDTTKRLEEDMEKISEGKKSEDDVIKEGKDLLLEALKIFDKNKAKIGEEMQKGLQDSEEVLGACPKDGGKLVVRKSRIGKSFAACSNYPKCTVTYSLPQNAKIVPTGNVCPHCHTPIVKVIRRAKGVFEMDLDMNCITHAEWKKKQEAKAVKAAELEGQKAAAPKKAVAKKAVAKKEPKAAKPKVKKTTKKKEAAT